MRPALPAVLAGVLIASGGVARADDWPTPGLDVAQARSSAERSGARFADGRWSFAATRATRTLASPVVADGFVVTVDLDGIVRALRAEDGQVVWRAAIGHGVQGTPAVARGRVFVPTLGNSLVALRLGDGAELWTRETGGMTLSSPTPFYGDLFVAAGFPQRHILRLSGATGQVVWQSPPVMAQFSNASPAVGAGLVVVGANGGRYYAFSTETGLLRWEYRADGIVNLAAPIIVGGRVYMAGGNDSHRVHAVDATTGVVVAGWPHDIPTAAPDVTGTLRGRERAVSSFSFVGGLLILQTRLDDRLETDANGTVDRYLSRESVVAIDPASGAVAWQHELARAEVGDPNQVPKHFLCPTPAGFADASASALVVAASSLAAVLVVLDAATGEERGRHPMSGPALASPVLANGRLVTVGMNGIVESLVSSFNHAPAAPILAENARPLDSGDVTLRWLPAVDPEGELASYQLRIDADGEMLETWQQQIFVGPGVTSTRILASLNPGTSYQFAVRARDRHGALSSWSTSKSFTVVTNPVVRVGDGQPASSLRAALAAAQPGEVVVLGPGRFTLAETLHVRGGVSLQGAGAGMTILDAGGLSVGVSFENESTTQESVLEGMTVHGADTCVEVRPGRSAVRMTHVIVRDCRTDGVAVKASGIAKIANATLVGDATAIHAMGTTEIKNSLLIANGTALRGEVSGTLTSSYNNVFGNRTNYDGLGTGEGDFSRPVVFVDLDGRDLLLPAAQPSTDKGDPADPVGAEPAPNGARINLGAFGGTADAERTDPSTAVVGNPAAGPVPGTDPAEDLADGGCALGGKSRGQWTALVLLAPILFRRRPTARIQGARRR